MWRFAEKSKQPFENMMNLIRFSCLAKTTLQGILKGKRRGRQKKRWEDNIGEWTRMDFAKAAENKVDRGGYKVICGAPTIFQCDEIN